MKKVTVVWIGKGKSGLHHYAKVQYEIDGFIGSCFIELTAVKATTLTVGEEIDVPSQLIK